MGIREGKWDRLPDQAGAIEEAENKRRSWRLGSGTRMKAFLVRIGIDQAYGGWNPPVAGNCRFVYVPIPEKHGTKFHVGLERRYDEFIGPLQRFCRKYGHNFYEQLRFPSGLLARWLRHSLRASRCLPRPRPMHCTLRLPPFRR